MESNFEFLSEADMEGLGWSESLCWQVDLTTSNLSFCFSPFLGLHVKILDYHWQLFVFFYPDPNRSTSHAALNKEENRWRQAPLQFETYIHQDYWLVVGLDVMGSVIQVKLQNQIKKFIPCSFHF